MDSLTTQGQLSDQGFLISNACFKMENNGKMPIKVEYVLPIHSHRLNNLFST